MSTIPFLNYLRVSLQLPPSVPVTLFKVWEKGKRKKRRMELTTSFITHCSCGEEKRRKKRRMKSTTFFIIRCDYEYKKKRKRRRRKKRETNKRKKVKEEDQEHE